MWRRAGQIALWCLGIGGSLALLNELSPLRWHAALAAQLAERYWQQKLREVSGQLYAYRERPSAWQAHSEVLFLRYTASGQLREWNTARWPIPKVPPSLRYVGPELVQDDRSLYYCLKLPLDTQVQVVLIPILVEPPPSLASDGAYTLFTAIGLPEACLHRSAQGIPFVLSDLQGRSLLRLYMGCPERLRLPLRWVYVGFLGIGLFAGLLYLNAYLRAHLSEWKYRWYFLAILVGLWQILHWTGLPERLFEAPFASVQKCALSPLHTSLWDIAWTLLILLWLTTFLHHIPTEPKKPAFGYLLGFLGVWGLFGGAFYLLVRDSQVEIDPMNRLSWTTLAGWTAILMIFWHVLVFLRRKFSLQPWGVVAIGAVGVIFLALWVGLAVWAAVALGLLYGLLLYPSKSRSYLVEAFVALCLVVALNGWIDWGYELRARRLLEAQAPRVLRLQDPALEYRLAQVLPRLAADSTLWAEAEEIDASFVARLVQRHLLFLGEHYKLVISCWNPEGLRVDNLFEERPLNWRQVVPVAAKPTLAPGLYFLQSGSVRYIYVARVPVSRAGELIELQLELHPRMFPLRARLYPLPESEYPPLSYALYEGMQRLRQWGEGPFPPFPPTPAPVIWSRSERYYEYIVVGQGKLIAYLRYPVRDRATHLATITVLLTLLGLGIAVQRLPAILPLLRTVYHRQGTLSTQLQALFWSLIALSLIVLTTASFFLFIALSREQLRQTLQQRLTAISAYFFADAILLEKLSYWVQSYIPREESYIRDLMRRTAHLSGAEVFLYTAEGRLYSSTLPPGYADVYGVPYLEPQLLTQMRSPTTETLIFVEPGGKRLLGYLPLRASDGRLVGVLHIPIPLSPQAFFTPLRYFIGYAVNVYLIVAVGAIFIGIVLLQRFSEGLKQLVEQLRSSDPSGTPPYLSWQGRGDEIALLVSAYNEMVDRLRINQEELRKATRRASQQEMAFQAAHEIKTALTPLKLQLQHLQRIPTVDPEKLHSTAARLLDRVESLVRIANKFTRFARLGTGEEPKLVPVNLSRFVREQVELYIRNPNIQFHVSLPAEPVWIAADVDALQQILSNLLDNAVQALEGHAAPEIRLSVVREEGQALLAVQDNGPGIPPEIQSRIFEFYFTTKRTGTGMGLAIVKQMVENMGGQIHFKSKVGQGTTFYVAFPASEAPQREP